MPKTSTATKLDDQAHLTVNQKKWGEPLMKAGWTCLPNIIVHYQDDLGLDPLDMNIILYLASRWWKADGKPYPAKASMAKAMGKSPSTIRRRIKRLEAAGLVRRELRPVEGDRSQTNVYHLDGLVEEATHFAAIEIQRREDKKALQDRIDSKKGRAKLKVLKGGR